MYSIKTPEKQGDAFVKLRIEEIGLRAAIARILPAMVEGGDLAKGIQSRLGGDNPEPDQKGGNPAHAALTDADILVETALGVHLFVTFSDVTFKGEEQALNRIWQYFPPDAPYVITLDPINGTLFFKSGLPTYDMILTICRGREMVAAVDYIPGRETFFIAIQGEGAYTTTASDVRAGRPWRAFRLAGSARRVLTQRAGERTVRCLCSAGYTVVEMESYEEGMHWSDWCCDLFTGGLGGILKRGGHLIDWGAISFIASLSGGMSNNPIYDPGTMRAPLVLASGDEATFRIMMEAV